MRWPVLPLTLVAGPPLTLVAGPPEARGREEPIEARRGVRFDRRH